MRRGSCAAALGLLAGFIAAEARADVAGPFRPPRPQEFRGDQLPAAPKPQVARVVIEASDRVPETRLQIPRKLLATLQADAQASGGWGLRAVPLWPVALTLGLVLAGCALRLARGRRPFAFVGVGLLLVALALSTQESVSAHQPLPPIPNFKISGQIVVEIVPDGDAIKLLLDKKHTWPTRYVP
jgi:hypothetical protein